MLIKTIVFICVPIALLVVLFSMVGIGGGVVYVPILIAAGIPFREAVPLSLLMIIGSSIPSTLFFGYKKLVDWGLLTAIIPLSFLSSLVGGYIAHWINPLILKFVLSAILIVAVPFLFRFSEGGQSLRFVPNWGCWNRCCGEYQYRISMLVLIPTASLISFLAAMVGIGGGLFLLPLLILLLGCPTRIAIGISSTYVGIVALSGFLGHVFSGITFNIWLALPLMVITFLGALLGQAFSVRISVPRLKIILAIVLTGLATWMIVEAFIPHISNVN